MPPISVGVYLFQIQHWLLQQTYLLGTFGNFIVVEHQYMRYILDLRVAAVKSTTSTSAMSSQIILNPSRRQFFSLKTAAIIFLPSRLYYSKFPCLLTYLTYKTPDGGQHIRQFSTLYQWESIYSLFSISDWS